MILLDPRRTSLPFVVGIVLCSLIVLAPELLPALCGRSDAVWSPVRSMNYHVGDFYYYAAYVQKLIADGLPISSPSASELAGVPLVETWRFLPLLLGALPGIAFSDMRFVIVAGYGLSAALIFSMAFFLANCLTKNRWVAMGVGFAALFGTDRLWVNLPSNPPLSQDHLIGWPYQLLIWFRDLCGIEWASILATTMIREYDFYGDTFRYGNLSLSEPILLAFFTATTMVHLTRKKLWIVAMAAMAPAMAFSYPSHTLIAYMLLIAFASLNLLLRDYFRMAVFVGVGIGTLIFLIAIDYPGMLSNILNNSELWVNIFSHQSWAFQGQSVAFVASSFLNKYVMTFAVMLLLTRSFRSLRHIVWVVGLIGIPLSLVYMFDIPLLWGRFLGRGIDHIWWITFSVCLGYQIAKWCPTFASPIDSKESTLKHLRMFVFVVSVALLLGLTAVPFWAFVHLGLDHCRNESRFLPRENMDAYRWINANIPANTPVAALDWEDISILPIYSRVSLVIGHSVIDGRTPRDELERFVRTYQFLGHSREELERLVTLSPQADSAYRRSYRSNPPFVDEKTFDAYQFMAGVLYWPYVERVDNLTIVTNDAVPAINPRFLQYVLKIYDDADPATYIQRYSVGAIVVRADDPFTTHQVSRLREVYRNLSHVIYMRQ